MAHESNTRSTLLPQTTPPAVSATASNANGSLQMDHNAWRSTKLDGPTVYNDQGNNTTTGTAANNHDFSILGHTTYHDVT